MTTDPHVLEALQGLRDAIDELLNSEHIEASVISETSNHMHGVSRAIARLEEQSQSEPGKDHRRGIEMEIVEPPTSISRVVMNEIARLHGQMEHDDRDPEKCSRCCIARLYPILEALESSYKKQATVDALAERIETFLTDELTSVQKMSAIGYRPFLEVEGKFNPTMMARALLEIVPK